LSYKKRILLNKDIINTYNNIKRLNLDTICIEGNCPNVGECFSKGKMTFLILGDICTRNCHYCSVKKGKMGRKLDYLEIEQIKEIVGLHNLSHIVITSVTRDDLEDGGSLYYAKLCRELKEFKEDLIIEILTPDFKYNMDAIRNIILSKADILSHNIELSKSVYDKFRPTGDYKSSLDLLKEYVKSGKKTKSAFIIGFGESMDDIKNTIYDIAKIGVNYLSIGQYLAPTNGHLLPKKYYTHKEFKEIEEWTKDNFNFDKLDISFYSRSSYMELS
jgi:lipoic acid synthetase